jgi:hypothetical protein
MDDESIGDVWVQVANDLDLEAAVKTHHRVHHPGAFGGRVGPSPQQLSYNGDHPLMFLLETSHITYHNGPALGQCNTEL